MDTDGGMQTVIWTDVMQFLLFMAGAVLTLFWITGSLEGGWSAIFETAGDAGKFTLLTYPRPTVGFTLWVAILAVPFQNLGAFGVDQQTHSGCFAAVMSQMHARRSLLVPAAILVTLLMLMVGAVSTPGTHNMIRGKLWLTTLRRTATSSTHLGSPQPYQWVCEDSSWTGICCRNFKFDSILAASLRQPSRSSKEGGAGSGQPHPASETLQVAGRRLGYGLSLRSA